MVFNSMRSLFLNTLMFMGLFNACRDIYAIPVNLFTPSSGGTIQYPIYIACECDYSLYVDGKNIQPDNTKVETFDYLETGWNATKKFYPAIYDESPKIIAFNGISGQYAGLLNGFIMDMNNGEDYTRYEDWKCADFSTTASKVPPIDWFTYDYDDSEWRMATSFGKNYQNNSFQIFETERREINLQAEWIWTSDNTVTNVYCRKKNENVMTIPLSTSAPPTVSPTIHTSRVQTSAPPTVQTSAPHPAPTIVISPHIQIIIQNIKFSQRRSNTHVDNLFRKLSLYRDEYKLYKLLTIARLHLKQHYNALFYDIKHILEKQNIYDTIPTIHKNPVRNIPRYLQSMHTLNISIKKIEHSIQFIKGNHKYILLGILDKLKIQYQQDTQKLLTLIPNTYQQF